MAQRHKITTPPEWAKQNAILIAWPHAHTDWNYILDEVQHCYVEIAEAIVADEHLIIVTPDPECTARQLSHIDNKDRIHIIDIDTNDTWARDFGPITINVDEEPVALDFKFNGWGLKFAANKDNLINRQLKQKQIITCDLINCLNFVLEGGSIESDGNGTIMTTSNCLLSPNRNGQMSKDDIDNFIKSRFGAKQVLWVDFGELQGDDTDSHIDTLARFAPNDTIVYTRCQNTDDAHYAELEKMHEQICTFTNADGQPYQLATLPLPDPIYDEDGERLPATYANFLITNHLVLMPTYNQPHNDDSAINTLQAIFPNRKVIGIDCNALIKQHGSLHCITMQLLSNTTNFTL